MAKRPWWRATQTNAQARGIGITFAVTALARWVLSYDDSGLGRALPRIVLTVVASCSLAAWYVRRSRESCSGS
ncbi:hypothetical protein GCM10027586_02280 [Kineococcus gypseus]|uniref:hypothetical protein n=1 Tax=Kineococcus gypseus TaxID=1637102 RepID=UPI003D7D6142